MNSNELRTLTEAYNNVYSSVEQSNNDITPYEVILEFLYAEGLAVTLDEAEWIMSNQLTETDIVDILEAEKYWIQKAIKKPGALHKQLGVPEDKKISAKKMSAAKKKAKPGSVLARRLQLAKTLSSLKK